MISPNPTPQDKSTEGHVSEKLRKEVKLLAEKLGYRPHPMLSSLALYQPSLSI